MVYASLTAVLQDGRAGRACTRELAMTHRLATAWSGWRDAWQHWRGTIARRQAYEAIDLETLRDLGLCRSEYESFWTESRSPHMPTRRRLARWY